MFFGVTLKGPSSLIDLKVEDGVHLNNVALQLTPPLSADGKKRYVSFFVVTGDGRDQKEHLICTLDDSKLNHFVGLIFDAEDIIRLKVQGSPDGVIHVTGWYDEEENDSGSASSSAIRTIDSPPSLRGHAGKGNLIKCKGDAKAANSGKKK